MKTNRRGFIPLTNEEYHLDPAIGSSTLVRARKSWAHAMTAFEQTAPMQFGGGFHSLVGEPMAFAKQYAKAPVCDRRTKEGKEIYAKFSAENAGKTILSAEEYDAMDGMLYSLMKHKLALTLLTNGVAEQSAFWTDKDSGVLCKCRPDYLRTNDTVVDLKTAEDASEGAFQRTLVQYGRHIQTAFYLDGLSAVTGREFKNFVHLVIEKKPPYAIAVYSLDDLSIDQGRREYKKLLKDYAWCQKIGEYPSYPEEVKAVSLPDWAFTFE